MVLKDKNYTRQKIKAMALESSLLLRPGDKVGSMQEVITCVINQDPQLRKIWNKVFKDHEQELQRALGEV